MNEMTMPERMLQGKIYMTRKRGRPRLRWLEDVHDDLRKIKVKGWLGLMKNGGRLFRRPKLTLSCSAEGKEGSFSFEEELFPSHLAMHILYRVIKSQTVS
jgi:hypothetical protein